MQIVLSILGAIISFFGISQGIWLLLSDLTFTIPFSRKMVKYEVYSTSVHKQLIAVELFGKIITLILTIALMIPIIVFGNKTCLWISVASFFAGILWSLIFNRNCIGSTHYNIARFESRHSICMDMDTYYAIPLSFLH